MEWSTMVVPTYPEGGSHALKVCQHHHQVARLRESAALSGCQRDSKNTLLAIAPADSAETLTVTQRSAQRALCATVKVVGGGPRPSTRVRGVLFRAKSRAGDKFNVKPPVFLNVYDKSIPSLSHTALKYTIRRGPAARSRSHCRNCRSHCPPAGRGWSHLYHNLHLLAVLCLRPIVSAFSCLQAAHPGRGEPGCPPASRPSPHPLLASAAAPSAEPLLLLSPEEAPRRSRPGQG
jgi:hypothetical protein